MNINRAARRFRAGAAALLLAGVAGAVPNDTCPAIGETGGFLSEARLSMKKSRRLTPGQQRQVILFLKSL